MEYGPNPKLKKKVSYFFPKKIILSQLNISLVWRACVYTNGLILCLSNFKSGVRAVCWKEAMKKNSVLRGHGHIWSHSSPAAACENNEENREEGVAARSHYVS